MGVEILYGRNAARECLRARRRHVHELLVADNLQSSPLVDELVALAAQTGIPVKRIARKTLDKLAQGHQGIVLKTGRYPTVEVEDILHRAAKLNEPPFLIILDHVEDPHNLGAVLRTAEAVGVHGVILPKQRAAGVTPAVVNVSAGAVEHMWVAEVPNLAQVLKVLKQDNVWIAGVELDPAAQFFHKANLTGPIALVVGSEGKGLSRLIKDTCDFLIKLPMRGQVESLNASVACSLILYEVWRARAFS
ncbi:MAG TPA: 23S rRNA (guanosine(2251)-2'-O)-methyltransferase RlmB [Anaerolineae bacterium]|nr:23S rRNA (guanosine(2251)-2'-O)-methyltransferase RlmB [Anaerolineae bacterium]MCB9107413.1 23S rRNA (guanosine(2251)-2'-O)-methyltransferase RlmB [Anaerolineales bacterium]HRV93401.1 23S rRNA (guanosine(2251)-2'-O)-methyltransferase RlmB [Anaerolineae bacterium]